MLCKQTKYIPILPREKGLGDEGVRVYTAPMRRLSFVSLLAISSLCLPVAACKKAMHQPAVSLENPNNAGLTREQLEPKAAAGDADAMFRLGAIYHDGDGALQNYAKAKQYFEAAAAAGDSRSAFNLGIMYLKGQGVSESVRTARVWFEKATEGGDAKAHHQLGLMYYQGIGGLKKDFAHAKDCFEKAARQGIPDAQYNLGILYIRGEGVAQDPVEGYAWLAVARTYGYQKAVAALAKLEQQIPEDVQKKGRERAETLSDTVEAGKAVRAAPQIQ